MTYGLFRGAVHRTHPVAESGWTWTPVNRGRGPWPLAPGPCTGPWPLVGGGRQRRGPRTWESGGGGRGRAKSAPASTWAKRPTF